MTWRIQCIEPESFKQRLKAREPTLLAHWHGDEIALLCMTKYYRVATMTSTSKDGEIMNTILNLLGNKTSRGSSTRGAVSALKGLIRLLKSGYNVSMAVDGPKGPLNKVKPGIFELSKILKIPIYSVGVATSRAIFFEKSWNKTYFPKPFAKVILYWSEDPLWLFENQDPRDESLALKLESHIHAAKKAASKLIAEPRR